MGGVETRSSPPSQGIPSPSMTVMIKSTSVSLNIQHVRPIRPVDLGLHRPAVLGRHASAKLRGEVMAVRVEVALEGHVSGTRGIERVARE